ncbi:BP74-related protein [Rhizobium rhizogenes]|uniref:BP74-related protein n=1 Tax=Rhizobium rhizogenes TaxID=359 RepID=UPI0015733731|nr:calmodulin [Rhizobium rhizogenes]NTI77888.1 calmodulin [Rhizobium rhizogenes]
MPRYFAFTQPSSPGQEFIIELTDEQTIDHALKILSGEEQNEIHVHGRIIKRTQPYNPKFSFHLDPQTIRFFSMAIEVCDANMVYVEDHLDEAGGAFLPGNHWCPWDSRLTREVTFN